MSNAARELRIATESIPGRREANEDSFLAETLPDGRVLLAVADGMGGHAAGEVASALALQTLKECILKGMSLQEGIALANDRVFAKAKEPGKQGMGTTLVAVLLDGEEYGVANVGDSRGYLLDGNGIRQITQDHSFVAEAVKRGQSEEEAMSSRWKDALTRSVGTDATVTVDTFGPFRVEPDSAFLLCSDGLYKTLRDPDLLGHFRGSGGPKGAVQALVSAAYEGGSDDNISVVLGEWGEVPRERARGTMPMAYEPPSDEEEETEAFEEEKDQVAPGGVGSLPERGGFPVGLALGAVVVIAVAVVGYLLFVR